MKEQKNQAKKVRTRAIFLMVLAALACGLVFTGIKADAKTVKKNAKDVKAVKQIIKKQKARGAKIVEDLDDKDTYSWDKKGRLVSFGWTGSGLKGSLDLRGLRNLKCVNLYENSLTKVNVRGLKSLEIFNCNMNKLTSLNVSGLKSLKFINCGTNKLKKLNVKNCTSLNEVVAWGNKLKKIDLIGVKNSKTAAVMCDDNVKVNR